MSHLKHLKLFEELNNDNVFNTESMNQSDTVEFQTIKTDSDQERKLSSGEKAALARDMDLITEPQLAALYLVAQAKIARSQDRSDISDFRAIQRIERNRGKEDFREVPYGRLADILNMKPLTVSRTTNKFRLLILGEERPSEILYPKVISAFNQFKNMSPAEVQALADEAINYGADTNRSEEYADKISKQGEKTRENRANKVKAVGQAVKSLYTGLRSKVGDEKAAKMTISKIASERDLSPEEVKLLAREYLKGEASMRKLFNE